MTKEETRIRIIEKAKEMFLSFGFSKVSMDDLSERLGISKKTLYNHFVSKEQLLDVIIHDFMENLLEENDRIFHDEKLNFPDKIKKIFTNAATKLSTINPDFLEDVNKNAASAWVTIQQYKTEVTYLRFIKLLEEGERQGYIRKDINKTLAVILFGSAIDSIFNPNFTRHIPEEMYKKLPDSASAIFEGVVNIIFEGIILK
jgi:AcrR family transcriptional regulator